METTATISADNKQKTNNFKPKFKVGDWVIGRVTENEPRQIAEITKDGYKTTYGGWIGSSFEEDIRLWTIRDANDGDVISIVGIRTCIFKCIHGIWYSSHCFITAEGEFCMGYERHEVDTAINGNVKPSTKEQRDLLFQKMKESGYEWDSKNKELRKQCNQESIDKVKPKFQKGQWIYRKGLHPALIVNIDDGKYEIEFTDNGTKGKHPIDFIDRVCHLWTIEDAEDGDVLAIGNTYFLFKGETLKSSPTSSAVYISHCFAHSTGAFRLTNGRDCGKFHSIEDGIEVCPATKEQRDLLFHKMKEAGYGWDAKEKELIVYEKE